MSEHSGKWQAALEAAGVGAWEWDGLAERASWSAGLAGLHGLPPLDGDGPVECLLRNVHADDRGLLRPALATAAERAEALEVDYRVAKPDGGVRWLRWRGRGCDARAAGVCLDVTAARAPHDANAAPETCRQERLAEIEHKRAEETRKRLTAILEATPDLVAVSQIVGPASYINAAGRKLLGIGPEETVRLSDFRARPWRDFLLEEAVPAAVRNGVWSGETVFRSRDGREVPVSQVLLAHAGPDGAVQYLSTIARDVTERKRGEAALREQEAVLRSVLNHIPYSVFWKDPAGVYLGCNENLARDTGLGTPECAIGKTDYDMPYAREQADFYRKCDREVLETGRPLLDIEETQRRPDGGLAVLLTSKAPLRDADGRVTGVLGIYTDITERKAVEKTLRESEQRYRLLFERNLAGVVRTTPEGALLDCNEAFARILGCATREDALSRPAWDFYFQPAEREDLLARLRKQPALTNHECRLRRKDGAPVWVLENVSLLEDEPGGPILESTLIDVTERKRLEAQFLQAQKMEAVGRLAGGVAHDFNNLLTVIQGYGDLLLHDLALSDPLRQPAQEIRKAAERAADLTRQLLAFGRKTMIAPRTLDLNAVIREAETMLRRLIGEDVELDAALGPALPFVHVDPGQIQQVILNLAVNARDAMPTGGRLTFTTAAAVLDDDYARSRLEVRLGRYVELAVRDTGVGMTAEVRARLFEPFFTTKGVGQGTGLGLSTLYGIVKQSGGHVEVESEPGRGSTFRVYLPAVEPPPAARPADAPPGRGSETVLLVEDEALVRGFARAALRQSGYTVLEAADGAAALHVAEQHAGPIHLLATDMVMPRMGGRELAERLTPSRPDLKVLYLSGYTDDAVLRQGVREAEAAFLHKPFTAADLVRKARELLDA